MEAKYNVSRLICLFCGCIACCYSFFPDAESVTDIIGMLLLVSVFLLGNKAIREQIWANLELGCCTMYIWLFAMNANSPILQYVDRVFFVGLTIAIFIIKNRKNKEEVPVLQSNYIWELKRILLAVLLAFQFSGYQIFYDDMGRFCLGANEILSFALFVCWSLELISASEILLTKLRKRKCTIPEQKQVVSMAVVIFLLIFAIGIVMSVIYYPGIFSNDVITCYRRAIDISNPSARSDAHSFLYVLLLSIFARFGRNCYPITFSFIMLYSLVITAFLVFFYRRGMGKEGILVIATVLGMFPVNMFMMTALWKDIPFTISLISLTHALCKMTSQGSAFAKSKVNVFHLSSTLIFVALFRSNGMTAIAGTLVMIFIMYIRDHKYSDGLLVAIVSCVIIFMIKVPVYNVLHVDGMPESMVCQPFMDGIWQNIYAGSELAQDTEEYMYDIMSKQDWIDNYRSYYHNSFVYADRYGELKLSKSISGWLDCIRKHPFVTIGARFLKTDMVYSVFKNKGARMSYNVVFDASEVNLEDKFGWNWLEQTQEARVLFSKYFIFFDKNFAVLYRGGWNLVISLLIIWNSLRYSNKKTILALMPALCSTLALMLVSCYCDYRYIWYMFLLTPFYICNYAIQNSEFQSEDAN